MRFVFGDGACVADRHGRIRHCRSGHATSGAFGLLGKAHLLVRDLEVGGAGPGRLHRQIGVALGFVGRIGHIGHVALLRGSGGDERTTAHSAQGRRMMGTIDAP
ncbi:hypothetical protein WR25_13754 [Diploscapter pachys]|uniref:Uncharacterized protein n=1 Tax=Diploscapter pachys TaxID=2018661 RepID=A0A2A2K4H5_9BILA|nr:hypothetical protein WR25_13754 [Diploscapter pachys]